MAHRVAPLPLVLIGFDPQEPEEANSIAKELSGTADVRWLHEWGGDLARAPLDDIDVLVCFEWPRGLAQALGRMRRLRLIQRVPAGVESFPFSALPASPSAPRIATGSGSNAAWVAEHAFALLLACAKRVPWHDREMRQGAFHQMDAPTKELAGATLGILGYGAIGRRVAAFGRAFGMHVLAIRRTRRTDDGPEVLGGLEALDALLRRSDYLVVSLPLTPATKGLLDAEALERLPSQAVLVNVSRGDIVDAEALYEHLTRRPDAWAGLDVWWRYPGPGERFEQPRPFAALPNVVMTPHNAAMVPAYRTRMARFAAQNVRAFLTTGMARNLLDPADYADAERSK